jgi:hypothetical protein
MNKKLTFILIAGLITTFLLVAAPSAIVRAACSDSGGGIDCDGDNDTVTVGSGDTVSHVNGGGGEDDITNNGTVNGDVDGNDDNDTLNNSGTVNGDIYGQIGNDTITNEDTGEVTGTIYGWDGDDVINNAGTAGALEGGAGVDEVNNSGTVNNLTGDDGNDILNNTGTINGSLDGGFGVNSGDDTITNSGTVNGNIFGQEGNDTITNEDTGEVTGMIYAGDGDDVINNAGTAGSIAGGTGDDTVTLEDGSNVAGIIDGGEDEDGEDVDTLVFDFTTNDEDAFNQFNEDFNNSDPDGGSITWLADVIEWVNFEVLQNLVEYINNNPGPGSGTGSGSGGSGSDSGSTRSGAACFFNDGILLVCRYQNGDVAFLLIDADEATLHTYVTSNELASTQAGEVSFDNTNDEGYRLRATHSPKDTFVVELYLPGTGAGEDGSLALTGPDAQPRVYEFSF